MSFPPSPEPAKFGLLRRLGELVEAYADKPLHKISAPEFGEIRYQIAMMRAYEKVGKTNCAAIAHELGVSTQTVWARKHHVRTAPRDD